MATISFIRRKDSGNIGSLGSVIQYSFQEEKTEYDNGRLISGINCLPETALKDFVSTKERFNKTEGRQYYYAIQSFKDADIDPVLAHTLAREWAEKCYSDHEIVIATHLDTDNIHSHIIVNSVNCVNGKKINQNGDDIKRMRSVNDELCMKYGLPVCSAKQKEKIKPTKAGEYYSARNGSSWKRNMIIAIVSAMKKSGSKEEFIKEMKRKGYEVKWSDSRKNITFIESDNPKHRCRDDNLHNEKFLKENIENEFKIRRSYRSYREQSQPDAGLHFQSGGHYIDDDSGHGQMERAYQNSEIPESGNRCSGEGCEDSVKDRGSSRSGDGIGNRLQNTVGEQYEVTQSNADGSINGSRETSREPDEELLITGWESERKIFILHLGIEQYNKQSETQADTGSGYGSYSDRFTLPDAVHLVGSFATLIENTKNNPNRKHYKLSRKEIEKRRAQGQKDGFTQSM